MDHFHHRSGRLHAEDVDVAAIAEELGTPTFVYSAATLTAHYQRFQDAFAPIDPLICFAVKSNANLSVLRLLGELGSGMDVVSGGELHRALEAGIPAERCVYRRGGQDRTGDSTRRLQAGDGLDQRRERTGTRGPSPRWPDILVAWPRSRSA